MNAVVTSGVGIGRVEVDAISTQQAQILSKAMYVLNGLSIVSSLLLLMIFLYFRLKTPGLIDRVSLRLSVGVGLADLLNSLAQLVMYSAPEASWACPLSVWGFVSFNLTSLFLLASIALNVHWIFLQQEKNAPFREFWCYVGCVLGGVSLATPALALGKYGWSEFDKSCWFVDENTLDGFLWSWLTLYIWSLVVTAYCGVIIFKVVLRFRKEELNLKRTIRAPHAASSTSASYASSASSYHRMEESTRMSEKRRNAQIRLRRIVRRVIWYPVVPLITHFPNVIAELLANFTKNNFIPFWMLCLACVGYALPGLLNFIAFTFDPAVGACFRHLLHLSPVSTPSSAPSAIEAPIIVPARAMFNHTNLTWDDLTNLNKVDVRHNRSLPNIMLGESLGGSTLLSATTTTTTTGKPLPNISEEEEEDVWCSNMIRVGMEDVRVPFKIL